MMTRTGDEFVVDGTLARWDGRRYYSKIEIPTLVLVGRYDSFLEASREMADRIVPAHLRVLPAEQPPGAFGAAAAVPERHPRVPARRHGRLRRRIRARAVARGGRYGGLRPVGPGGPDAELSAGRTTPR